MKACEVRILPFANNHQAGIETITFIPIENLVTSITQDKSLLSPGDVLWAAGWVIKNQNSEFCHSNWNGWMKKFHAKDAKSTTKIEFFFIFLDVRATKDDVIRNGITIIQYIYLALGTPLAEIRYNMFLQLG